jgi:hypothetical protein
VAATLGQQWAGVVRIYRHPRFWWMAPLGGFAMGGFAAIQGLWAVPWMMEVEGLTRAHAAHRLLAMGIAGLAGYVLIGLLATPLARSGVHPRHLFCSGFAVNTLALALIAGEVAGGSAWWSLYGLGACANVLGFAVLSEGFPTDLAARANTAFNLMMFAGSFILQWGLGVIVDLARVIAGATTAGGLRFAFLTMLAINIATFAWFLRGWRRFAVPSLTRTVQGQGRA